MKFLAKTIALCLALVPLSSVSTVAQEQPGAEFDTFGFLSSCASFVPDVAFAPAMDGECIAQAIKLCHLSRYYKELSRCVHEATGWMVAEIDRFNSTDPDGGLPALEEFDTFDMDLSSLSGILPDEVVNFDCTQVQEDELSPDTLCKYAEAIMDWHKTRIVGRSSAHKATDDGDTQ